MDLQNSIPSPAQPRECTKSLDWHRSSGLWGRQLHLSSSTSSRRNFAGAQVPCNFLLRLQKLSAPSASAVCIWEVPRGRFGFVHMRLDQPSVAARSALVTKEACLFPHPYRCRPTTPGNMEQPMLRALVSAGVFSSACEVSSAYENIYEGRVSKTYKRLHIGLITYRTPGRWVCFGGGKRPRKPRVWKTKQRRGTVSKSQKLLERVKALSNVKEEVYGALDAFIAWELEFPLVTVKKALKILKFEKDWKRIIQIIKWMFSKGQGRTLGTYLMLLEAFDEEGRIEEAQELWQKVFSANLECTPRNFFTQVISMYAKHGMPEELLEVFADMEELDVKPDVLTVNTVARTYQKLGILDKAEKVLKKYPPRAWEYRYIKGKPVRVPVPVTSQNGAHPLEGGAHLRELDVDASDSTYDTDCYGSTDDEYDFPELHQSTDEQVVAEQQDCNTFLAAP